MLGHDLVSAVRRMRRYKLQSAVGITVLALGLSCFIAAYVFVDYLRKYDRDFSSSSRLFYIAESMHSAQFGIAQTLNVYSALPIAERLRLDVPELEGVARVYRMERGILVDGAPSLSRLMFVEADFTGMFDFVAFAGDIHGALRRPATAVATRRAAERLFGTSDVLGRTVTINGSKAADVTIAGVIEDVPRQSHLADGAPFALGFDLLVSWDVFEAVEQAPWMGWGNTSVMTYLRLPPNGDLGIPELDRRLAAIVETRADPLREVLTIGLAAKPVSTISPRMLQQQFEGINGRAWPIEVLTSILLLGGGLLVIACLNFVGLATAEASNRAFEIGARKSIGASRARIARLELASTAVRAALAIAAALLVVEPAGSLMTGPWQLAFVVPWSEPRFWLFLAGLLVVVTAAAGAYPALALASLRPVEALRPGRGAAGSPLLRMALVGVQFAVASFLLVMVAVLVSQRVTLHEVLLGRFDDPHVGFFLGPATGPIDSDVLSNELRRSAAITGAASMWQPPFQAARQQRELARSQDPGAQKLMADAILVGHDYFEVMQVPVLAGRVFSRDRADDATPQSTAELAARAGRPVPIVLDRDAARAFGWADPAAAIGQVVFAPGGAAHEVIGVVDDVPQSVRSSDSRGAMYSYGPRLVNFWLVRVAKDSVAAATSHIDAVMKKLAPDHPPPQRMFLDDLFANAYWTFALTQRVLTTLALFALAIAAIGLFGMASDVTVRRTREIGLRKSQGARAREILGRLLWDYSKPALWGNLAAFPLAFLAAGLYLDVFANPIELTPLPFAIALIATLLLGAVAVSGFVLRAAYLRPAEALRHE